MEDTVGNYLTVSYLEADGYAYPNRIDYAGHTGVAPHASVRFTYETRHDPHIVFRGGSSVRMDRRLAEIETYEGTSRISRYRLSYALQALPQRTRLVGIERCDGSGDCFPGIDLSWNAAGEGVLGPALPSSPGPSGNYSYYRPLAADFDGDGVSDLVWVRQSSSGVRATVALGDGSGGFAPGQSSTPAASGSYGSYEALTGDFNGDGVSDVVWAHGSGAGVKALVALSNGDGTFATAELSTPADTGDYASYKALVGDFDGNGITDLAWAHELDGGVKALVALSNGDGTFAAAEPSTPADTGDYDSYEPLVGDFNADGVSDLVWVDESSAGVKALVALSNGDGTFATAEPSTPADTGDYASYEPFVGDFNGDGVTDLVWAHESSAGVKALVALGEGDGTLAPAQSSTPASTGSYASYAPLAGDFNGDGITDLAWVHEWNGGLGAVVSLGNGDGTLAEAELSRPGASGSYAYYSPLAGDFNGDGVSDVAWAYQWTSGLRVSASLATAPADAGRVASIRPRLGADIVIDYARLTEAGVYMKDTGTDACAYPCVDIGAPLSVVVEARTENGIGGWLRTTYAYGGAKVNLEGRGFLGFRWTNTKNEQTGVYTTTEYLQEFPFIGRTEYIHRYVNAGSDTHLSTTRNTWSERALNGGLTRFAYVSRSVTDSYELEDGANNRPLTTVTTTSVYDDYGNPTSMTETTTGLGGELSGRAADSFTRTTTNTYVNDTTQWRLGRLVCAKVRAEAPGQPSQTRTSGFAYDAASGLLVKEVVEPRTGDIAGCVSTAADATLNRVTAYTRDRFGNRTTVTASAVGVASRTTTTAWGERTGESAITDNGRFAVAVTNALGHEEKRWHAAGHGVVTRLTGPNGLSTRWSHDGFGRVTRERRADGTASAVTYSLCTAPGVTCPAHAERAVRTTATGRAATVSYHDALGRTVRTEAQGFDARAVYRDTAYDTAGRVARASRAYYAGDAPLWAHFRYDALGRLKGETGTDGVRTEYSFPGVVAGMLRTNIHVYPARETVARTTARYHDALGRLLVVRDAEFNETRYTYDAFGNRLTTTDSAGNVRTVGYDLAGRKRTLTDPDMGSWSYAYNAFGELVSQTDAKGQTVRMSYDRVGRPVQRVEAEGTTTWTHDTALAGKGKVHRVTAPGGYARTHVYDALGRPESETETIGGEGYTLARSYDTAGRLSRLTYPKTGFAVEHVYNARGYLHQVRNAATPATVYWTAQAMNAAGRLEAYGLGNGLETVRTHDEARGVVKRIRTGTGGNDRGVQDLSYGYDAIGQLYLRRDDNAQVFELFEHDWLNRLTRARVYGADGAQAEEKRYTYDALGVVSHVIP